MAWTLPTMTPGMAAFVRAYLADPEKHTGRAVKAAGFRCKSPHAYRARGYKLLADERVKCALSLGRVPSEAISAHGKGRPPKEKPPATVYDPLPLDDRILLDREAIRERFALIANAKAVDLFEVTRTHNTVKHRLRALDELPPSLAYAIDRVELAPSGAIKVHLHSKVEALKFLDAGLVRGDGLEPPVDAEPPAREEDQSLEARLKRHGNVLHPSFPAKPGA